MQVDRRLAPRVYEGGATSAHTGGGGSTLPAYLSQKSVKNKNGKRRKIMLFDALLPGIRTPPDTSVRTGITPLINAGGKDAYRIGTAYHWANSSANSSLSDYCINPTNENKETML